MKVVLATGIYHPEIGGPATYVRALAEELSQKGDAVKVVTYGKQESSDDVVYISRSGSLFRWWRYAQALKKHAADADIVIAFSSVSTGIPVWLAGLQKPKKVLRLGGDFFWERYTARGGMKSLHDWYASTPLSWRWMHRLLHTFDHVIFSTRMQQDIYTEFYPDLPAHSVIENAFPRGVPVLHEKHDPFRLLFMGRYVGFKNLLTLVEAVARMQDVSLTFIGDGPLRNILKGLSKRAGDRIRFLSPAYGHEKHQQFSEHDVLILPSVTEISPNVALEARASGLPVLLTEKTGLSGPLASGMTLAPLRTADDICSAVRLVRDGYGENARAAAAAPPDRSWHHVADDFQALFQRLQ